MERFEVSQPISIILESSNYIPWAQAMSSLLKGHKLWRYITGDVKEPIRTIDETDDKLLDRMEEWDSKNTRSSLGSVIPLFHLSVFNMVVLTLPNPFRTF